MKFYLVDMRKTKVGNFVAGRWVLTVKKDKDGNFQNFSNVKPTMRLVTLFARYHPNTATHRISVLGLRNLVTVLMMRHVVGGRSLMKPYLTLDLFSHAQTDVLMFCMTILPKPELINHLAVSTLNR